MSNCNQNFFTTTLTHNRFCDVSVCVDFHFINVNLNDSINSISNIEFAVDKTIVDPISVVDDIISIF